MQNSLLGVMNLFSGTNRVSLGVPLTLDDGEWLTPWPAVLIGQIEVAEDVRIELIRLNESLMSGSSIDYGTGATLGRAVFDAQSRMASDALQRLGLISGIDFFDPEYSGILCGPGATFHVDEGFGTPGVLFIVTSLLGGGDLAMPNISWSTPFSVGRTVVFDAIQTHGVCSRGTAFAGDCPFACVSAEIRLSVEGCSKLGLVSRPVGSQCLELNRNNIDARTGDYVEQADELAFL